LPTEGFNEAGRPATKLLGRSVEVPAVERPRLSGAG